MHAGTSAEASGEDRRAPGDDDLAEEEQRVAPKCDGDVWSARAVPEHTPRAARAPGLYAPRGGARCGPAGLCHSSGYARGTVSEKKNSLDRGQGPKTACTHHPYAPCSGYRQPILKLAPTLPVCRQASILIVVVSLE